MKEIVECVANISEGQNPIVIEQISKAIESGTHTKLLHVDSGYDANRTVFTFIGDLKSLKESVRKMFSTSLRLIDMSIHHGKHPRIGAIDVCPFIPIQAVTMDKLITWTLSLAEELAQEFTIPIYLYEESSSKDHRKKLESIRKGEYEKLNSKMAHPMWKPDYGPNSGWQKSGACILGARKFLLAYNINLTTADVSIAETIAKKIRGSGYVNNNKRIPGLFPSVKAIGWYIEEYGCVQVSTNLTDYKACSFHQVFDACAKLAAELGVGLGGSELIGLSPKEPFLMAANHYGFYEGSDKELIEVSIKKLGLSSLETFNTSERIIEFLF